MINRILSRINIPKNGARLAKVTFGSSYPAFVENINIMARQEFGGIIFDTPSPLAQWRGKTHLSKEPGTIKWINGFTQDDVFFDIGANVGVYSLYGAIKKKLRVYSFEPSPFNFATLSRNIVLNNMGEKISAFCMALSDKTIIDRLYMSSVQAGAAHTGFSVAKNEFGNSLNPVHAQPTLGFTMDDFIEIFKVPPPNHIKIDVDGAEDFVIGGSSKTLANKSLKSLLIELPSRQNDVLPELLQKIINQGFSITDEHHPDGDNRLTNYILKR